MPLERPIRRIEQRHASLSSCFRSTSALGVSTKSPKDIRKRSHSTGTTNVIYPTQRHVDSHSGHAGDGFTLPLSDFEAGCDTANPFAETSRLPGETGGSASAEPSSGVPFRKPFQGHALSLLNGHTAAPETPVISLSLACFRHRPGLMLNRRLKQVLNRPR